MAVDLSGWGPRLRTNDRIETDVMLTAVLVHAPSQDAFLLEANRLEETLARPIPLHHVGLDPVNAQVVEGIRTDGLNDLLSDAPAPLLTVQIEMIDVPVIAVPVMQSDGPDDAVLAFRDHAPSNRRAGGIVQSDIPQRVTASPTRASGLRAVKRATSGWASMSKSAGVRHRELPQREAIGLQHRKGIKGIDLSLVKLHVCLSAVLHPCFSGHLR